jgi:hypothetical protein
MREELISIVEADLRQVVETEVAKFADHYTDCREVSSIWAVEDLDVSIEDIMLHGLTCDLHTLIFITREHLVEVPQYTCWVSFEDPEHLLYRRLAHIKVLFIPSLNKCYLEKRIHYYDIREVAEHIVKMAEVEAEQAGGG